MSNSYRQRLEQTIIYMPANMETFHEILTEARGFYIRMGVPLRRITVTTDDDGNLVVSGPVAVQSDFAILTNEAP